MKKNIIKVFIFLIIIGSIYCLYTKYNKYQMLKEIDDSVPIVFAAELEDGNKGTFKYNIKTGEYEKISDYIFQELSYSDDYEKIIGVIWEDRFQGIAELDMRDYTFKPIIDMSILNVLVKAKGLDEIKYDGPGVVHLNVPKYYNDGYTFYWGNNSGDIIYIKKENNKWKVDIVNSSRFKGYTYFIKKGVEEDLLFLETEKRLFSKKMGRGTIIEKIIGSSEEKGILDIDLKVAAYPSGLMDMPVDMSKIAYYEEPEIYIYDLNTEKKKHVTNQYLFNQNIIELKFSPDGKYMFYTVGDNPFFGGSFYRRTFYLVDIESGNKTKLVKWKTTDMFYGIDW